MIDEIIELISFILILLGEEIDMANNSKNAVKKNQAVKMASRKSSKKTSSKASAKSKKDNSSKKKLPSFSFQGNGGIPLKNEIWVVASLVL